MRFAPEFCSIVKKKFFRSTFLISRLKGNYEIKKKKYGHSATVC